MLRAVRCKALWIEVLLFHIASRLMYHDLILIEILNEGAHSKWTFEFLPRGRSEFHASERDSTEAIENPF